MDSDSRTFYLGRYNCIEQLGTGPLGETFRAKIYGVAGFEKQFAVKRLHQHLSSDEGFVARFVQAASAFAALEHQRIARVHEVNAQGAHYYIVIDLVRGLDLRRLLDLLRQRGEALSADVAATIAGDVAEALEYAHARTAVLPGGVLHLGLTAQSVMVTYDGEVKLVDVGLLAGLVRPSWSEDDTLTPTLAYVAPEVWQAETFDGRADIFSLGVLLHELTSGSRVFVNDRATELRQAMEAGPPPPPPADPRFQRIITRALQPDPARRFATMREMREALQEVVKSRGERARSDLSALVRRLVLPRERRTGAFAAVTLPTTTGDTTTPLVAGRQAMSGARPWAPPAKPPATPMMTVPMQNTLAGIGPGDALLRAEDMVEIPGLPTDKTVTAPHAEDAETNRIQRVAAEGSGVHSLEAETTRFQRAGVDDGAAPSEGAARAASGGPSAETAGASASASASRAGAKLAAADGSEHAPAAESSREGGLAARSSAAGSPGSAESLVAGAEDPHAAAAISGAESAQSVKAGASGAANGAAAARGLFGSAAAAPTGGGGTTAQDERASDVDVSDDGLLLPAEPKVRTSDESVGRRRPTTLSGLILTDEGPAAGSARDESLAAAGQAERADEPSVALVRTSGEEALEASWTPPAIASSPPSPEPVFAEPRPIKAEPLELVRSSVPGTRLPPRNPANWIAMATIAGLALAGATAVYLGLRGERLTASTGPTPAVVTEAAETATSGSGKAATTGAETARPGMGPSAAASPTSAASNAATSGLAPSTPAASGTATSVVASLAPAPLGASSGTTSSTAATSGAALSTPTTSRTAMAGAASPTPTTSSAAVSGAASSTPSASRVAMSGAASPTLGASRATVSGAASSTPAGASASRAVTAKAGEGGGASAANPNSGADSSEAASSAEPRRGQAVSTSPAASAGGARAAAGSGARAVGAATGSGAATSRDIGPQATAESAQLAKGGRGTANHAIVSLAAAARAQSAGHTGGAEGAAASDKGSAVAAAANPRGDVKAANAGGVGITSVPAGATIFVDGEARGTTPAQLTLTPGKHKVVVAGEHQKLLTREVDAAAGGQLSLTLEAAKLPATIAGPAGLKVRCRTHGELRILVDGADTGLSCPNDERISVTPGTHKIGLFSPRTGQTHEVEHDVVDGEYSTRVYVKF